MMRHIVVVPVPNYKIFLMAWSAQFYFADFMALLADSDLFSRGPSSLMAILDSLRSNAPVFVLYSAIFIFLDKGKSRATDLHYETENTNYRSSLLYKSVKDWHKY